MNQSIAVLTKEGLIIKWCYRCLEYQPAVQIEGGWLCCCCGHRIRDWVSRLLYDHR